MTYLITVLDTTRIFEIAQKTAAALLTCLMDVLRIYWSPSRSLNSSSWINMDSVAFSRIFEMTLKARSERSLCSYDISNSLINLARTNPWLSLARIMGNRSEACWVVLRKYQRRCRVVSSSWDIKNSSCATSLSSRI